METDEIVKLKKIGMLSERLLNTLKHAEDKRGMYIAEIRVYDYYELASIIKNLMKLCITAVHYDRVEVPPTIANQHIDVGLILGIALQLFPIDEFELINEISDLYNNQNDKTKAES